MSNELVTIETVNAVEVFQKGGADKKHKAEIHNEIMTVLIEKLDVSQPADEMAKSIIIAIATGEIPHVKIIY